MLKEALRVTGVVGGGKGGKSEESNPGNFFLAPTEAIWFSHENHLINSINKRDKNLNVISVTTLKMEHI